ncbi:MAG: hypothetical protein ACKOYI_04560, partial [Actinomycetota bacterium]
SDRTLRWLEWQSVGPAPAMFGRKYSIHADKDDLSPPMRYQLDIRHLNEAGFTPSNDVNHEIDMLLAAAQKHLGL